MSDEYREIVLGKTAYAYLQEQLASGKTLGRLLLARALESGRIQTFLPSYITDTQALDLETGGKLPSSGPSHRFTDAAGRNWRMEPKSDMDDFYARWLHAKLRESPTGSVCLFEDAIVSASDPTFKRIRTRSVTYGEDVYHLALPEDSVEQIGMTLHQAGSWLTIGVLTTGLKLAKGGHIVTAEQLHEAARETSLILVGAYDGEGFILWHEQNEQDIKRTST
jgi:hypothetical protein